MYRARSNRSGSLMAAWVSSPLLLAGAVVTVAIVAWSVPSLVLLGALGSLLLLHSRARVGARSAADPRVEQALASDSFVLGVLMEHTPDHIYFKDRDSRFVRISRTLARYFGLDEPAEAVGKTDFDFFGPEHARRAFDDEQEIIRTGRPIVGKEEKETWPDGHETWVTTTKVPLRDRDGRIIGTFGISRDITEQKVLGQQLVQSQKMEAVGRLAGGVAHDFNNALTVIKGYCDLVLDSSDGAHSKQHAFQQIRWAADHAASLTAQLLAFSRKRVLNPRVINLNGVLAEMRNPVSRMIGEDIELVVPSDPDPGSVRADPNQVQQGVINLAVNARDAMPSGGRLTIETANVDLDEAFVRSHPGAGAGPYVMLSVGDTGEGMSPEVREHVFEPFFTTKGDGRGTGLGLSMVYGFVKQSGGIICVESEPGRGTTFRIYLPRVAEKPESRKHPPAPVRLQPSGRQTVLLVEDERVVRQFVARALRACGYTVIEAVDGSEALRLAAGHGGRIDLLVTDVVMPGIDGVDLARRLRHDRADLKVLYISGYAERAMEEHGLPPTDVSLLKKPFSPAELARAVRWTIDAPEPVAAAAS